MGENTTTIWEDMDLTHQKNGVTKKSMLNPKASCRATWKQLEQKGSVTNRIWTNAENLHWILSPTPWPCSHRDKLSHLQSFTNFDCETSYHIGQLHHCTAIPSSSVLILLLKAFVISLTGDQMPPLFKQTVSQRRRDTSASKLILLCFSLKLSESHRIVPNRLRITQLCFSGRWFQMLNHWKSLW